MQVYRSWSIYDTVFGLAVAGVLGVFVYVFIVGPQFSATHDPVPGIRSQLQFLRSQIELYNIQNPKTPYDATTPVGPAFWNPLVKGGYLQRAPANLLRNNSTVVGATPDMGTGWVWAAWPGLLHEDDEPPFYVIMAVDANGNFYDGDQDGLPD